MKIICLHPNLLRRMLEHLGTTEIQRFQGAHGSAAAAAMAPLPGVTNRKLVHNLFSSEMSAGRGRLSPTLLAAPFRFIPALDAVFHHKTASTDSVWFRLINHLVKLSSSRFSLRATRDIKQSRENLESPNDG